MLRKALDQHHFEVHVDTEDACTERPQPLEIIRLRRASRQYVETHAPLAGLHDLMLTDASSPAVPRSAVRQLPQRRHAVEETNAQRTPCAYSEKVEKMLLAW